MIGDWTMFFHFGFLYFFVWICGKKDCFSLEDMEMLFCPLHACVYSCLREIEHANPQLRKGKKRKKERERKKMVFDFVVAVSSILS